MTQTPQDVPPVQTAPPVQAARAVQGGPGLAIAALVLGILACIPCAGMLLGVLAVVLGILALALKQRGKALAISGIVLGALLGLGSTLVSMGWWGYKAGRQAQKLAGQAVCAANASQIAMAVQLYASNNNEQCPPNLDVLVQQGLVAAQTLQCPRANSGAKCDYFYLPPAKDARPGALLICEFQAYHPGGRTVVRVDGSTMCLTEEELAEELADEDNAAFAAALKKIGGAPKTGSGDRGPATEERISP